METQFFMVAPKISTFWLIFVEVFHSQGVDQAPNTSQDSSLTRWEPEQDYGGSNFSTSQVIFVVSTWCLQNTNFWKLEKSSKSMLGKPRGLPRLREAHRLQFEFARKLNKDPGEHRLNLLYESHPAETQVDGLPRASSSLRQGRFCTKGGLNTDMHMQP